MRIFENLSIEFLRSLRTSLLFRYQDVRMRLCIPARLAVSSAIIASLLLTHACGSDRKRILFVNKDQGKPSILAPILEPAGVKNEFAVLNAGPKGEVTDASEVTVSFSTPVKTLGTAEVGARVNGVLPFRIWPSVEGDMHWPDSRTVIFKPAKPLIRSTTYRVEVSEKLRDLKGNALKQPYVWRFTTEGLRVVDSTLGGFQRYLARPDQAFGFRFNHTVDSAEVAKHCEARFQKAGKQQIVKFRGEPYNSYSKTDIQVRLTPIQLFPSDTEIEFVMSKKFAVERAPDGKDREVRERFRTAGPLKILRTECENPRSFRDRSCYPSSTVLIHANHPISTSDTEKFVSVTGPDKINELRTSYETDHLLKRYWLRIDRDQPWKSGSTYRFTLRRGLTDDYEQALKEEYHFQIAVKDAPGTDALRHSDLELEIDDGEIIENKKRLNTLVHGLNMERGLFALRWLGTDQERIVWELENRNRDFFASRKNITFFEGYHLKHNDLVKSLDVSSQTDKYFHTLLDLDREIPTENKQGVGLLRVTARSVNAFEQYFRGAFFRVSQIGLNVKQSNFGVWVWAVDHSSGKPLTGTEISVRDETGALIASGKTGPDGFLSISPTGFAQRRSYCTEYSWDREGLENRKLYVFARKGSAFGLALPADEKDREDNGYDSYRSGSVGLENPNLGFTDRGVYQPAERVFFKGIVRNRDDWKLQIPKNKLLSFKVIDSRSDKIYETTVAVSPFGTYSFDFLLPQNAHLGRYSVKLVGTEKDGTCEVTSFRVDQFKSSKFSFSFDLDTEEVVNGQAITADISSRYLFGRSMTAASYRLRAQSSYTETPDFPAYDGWSFRDSYEEIERDVLSVEKVERFSFLKEGVLGSTGTVKQRIPIDIEDLRDPLSLTIESAVTDLDWQEVSSQKTVMVHPGEFYLGIKPEYYFYFVGEQIKTKVVSLSPKGQPMTGKKVRLTFLSRSEKCAEQYTDFFGPKKRQCIPVFKKLRSCSVVTNKGVNACRFGAPRAGTYVIRASSTDALRNRIRSSAQVWVESRGSDSSECEQQPSERKDAITLSLDKTSYNPGETALLTIDNPFGRAHGYLTIEAMGLVEKRNLYLASGSQTVKIGVKEAYIPNVHLNVVLATGRTGPVPADQQCTIDRNIPRSRSAYATLRANREFNRLTIAINTDKTTYVPKESVTVKLSIRDESGKRKRSEVTLYAVDHGVLMLTDYEVPQPLEAFYPLRASEINSFDTWQHLFNPLRCYVDGQPRAAEGSLCGGGTGEGTIGSGNIGLLGGMNFRKDFKSTPFFKPDLVTDTDGNASVKFELPENLTRFRIIAVAVSKDNSFGTGETSITVNKPLLVNATSPSVTQIGDRFKAGVVVHDLSSGGGEATVAVRATNLSLQGESTKRVVVPEGGSVPVRWDFEADKTGEALLQFVVKSGAFSDGIEQRLAVNSPMTTGTVATYGLSTESVKEALGDLSLAKKDGGDLKIALGSTAVTGLTEAAQSLINYRYACNEQLTSRLIPLVTLPPLDQAYGLRLGIDKSEVADIIKRLVSSQLDNGGFGLWNNSKCPNPWLSAYIYLGLTHSLRAGYSVPERTIERIGKFLQAVLRDDYWWRVRNCERRVDWWDAVSLDTKAYIVYVLAEAGNPASAYHETTFEKRYQISVLSRLLLARAFALSKHADERKKAKQLLQEALNNVRQTAKSAQVVLNSDKEYRWIFQTDVSQTALALQSLLALDPHHPLVMKFANWILDNKRVDGTWGTTYNNAEALLALAHYLRVVEHDIPNYKVGVSVGGRRVLSSSFRGRSKKIATKRVAMKQLMDTRDGIIEIIKEGKGNLYYGLTLSYALKELPVASLNRGFAVEKEYRIITRSGQESAYSMSQPVTSVKEGDSVLARVILTVTGDRTYVVVDDPIPAGLVVLNPDFETTSREEMRLAIEAERRLNEEEYETRSYKANPFYHREIWDDRISIFADSLAPGVYSYTYVAKAAIPGTFTVAPTRAMEMYTPETFGRTGALKFKVLPSQ